MLLKKHLMVTALLCGAVMPLAALAANNPQDLTGYSETKALPEFTKYLADNDAAFSFFKGNANALMVVLDSTQMQKDMVSGETSTSELLEQMGSTEGMSEMQQFNALLARVPDNDTGVKDDKSLNAAVDKELDDAVKGNPTKGGNTRLGGVIKPPTEHNTGTVDPSKPAPTGRLLDMSAIPDGSLDKNAKGWPKYLKVSDNCAAAEAGKNYIHVFQFKDTPWRSGNIQGGAASGFGQPGNTGAATNDTIAPWFAQGGDWFYANATDKEVYAVPFYAGHAGQALGLSWINESAPDLMPQFSISECPGDFTNADAPSGIAGGVQAQLMYDDAYEAKLATLSGASADYFKKHRLVPGKRYFMNMRPNGGVDSCSKAVAYYRSNGNTNEVMQRDGADVCSVTVVAHGANDFYTMANRPLYTGHCLNSGPYPANYNSITCQEKLWRCDNSNPNAVKDIKQVCFDAKGHAAEQRYEAKCVGGTMRWAQGAGKPAYDSYVCVSSFNGQVAFDDMPIHEVCARHSDGYKRTNQVLTGTGQVVSEQKYTCGFDSKEKVYRWKLASGPMTAGGQHFKTSWFDKDGNLITTR